MIIAFKPKSLDFWYYIEKLEERGFIPNHTTEKGEVIFQKDDIQINALFPDEAIEQAKEVGHE